MKKKSGNIFYTIMVLSVLVAITVFLMSRKQTTGEMANSQDIIVKISPEKQLVKPDDIIEEAIIGDVDQPVVGNGTMVI
jgi:preprotein translocase subunit YajC